MKSRVLHIPTGKLVVMPAVPRKKIGSAPSGNSAGINAAAGVAWVPIATAQLSLILSKHRQQPALHLDVPGWNQNRLQRGIGGLQADYFSSFAV